MAMAEWEKVIKGLEKLREYADSEVHPILSPDNWGIYSELRGLIDEAEKDVLALMKAQNLTVEPKLLELEDETKAWLDEMDAVDALGNIAYICMDFDGYRTANGLGELINEVRTYASYCAYKLLKTQKPICKCDMWFCGRCQTALAKTWMFCPKCGQAVKWE